MRRLSIYLNVSIFILVVGYILYNESRPPLTIQSANPSIDYWLDTTRLGKTVTYDLPDNLEFAGEPVPLDIPDVRERLDREVHINTYWHNHSITLIKRANRWLPQIAPILEKNGIPDDFKYLSAIESDLANTVSFKNAVGFWQFLRSTAREYGLEVSREVDERYHPIKSTEAACRYLNKAYKRFGDWTLVAASYNRGMRGISRSLEQQKVDNYYDLLLVEETSRYVFRIIAAKELLSDPEKYGFQVESEHLYQAENLRPVTVDSSVPDLVKFAEEQGINYKLLKRHNPWLRSNKLTVRKGKTYEIMIPVDIQDN